MSDEQGGRGNRFRHGGHFRLSLRPGKAKSFNARAAPDEPPVRSVSSADARKGASGGGGPHHGLLKHLSKDDLVLYQYGEIRTAPAEGHLSVCRGCRDRLRVMRLDVERLTPAPPGDPSRPPAPQKGAPRLPAWRRLLLRLALAGSARRG
ncbi:MAG TPA: hypothetical protein VGS98_05540 [Thermoanaerobaculia bacterium]|nr:hypothetical protein [Thermoanaerobaculia bacterium]